MDQEDHKDGFSEKGFWKKVKKLAKGASSQVVEKALYLYFVLQKEETPRWAKATILGALGYFIFAFDAMPDPAPVVGYSDDLGLILLAIATVSAYIDDSVKDQANEKLKQWFGDENEA